LTALDTGSSQKSNILLNNCDFFSGGGPTTRALGQLVSHEAFFFEKTVQLILKALLLN